jgi:hypothetical protein
MGMLGGAQYVAHLSRFVLEVSLKYSIPFHENSQNYLQFYLQNKSNTNRKKKCIARASVVDFFQRLRYVCGKYINETVLGGASKIVEIDESMFARVKHRGKDLKRKLVWVFGMKERDSGKCYMQLVSARNAATLIPIIY